jgi:hypothetical protein
MAVPDTVAEKFRRPEAAESNVCRPEDGLSEDIPQGVARCFVLDASAGFFERDRATLSRCLGRGR